MRPFAFARRSTVLLITITVILIDQITKVAATHDPSSLVLPERNPAYAFGIVSGPAPVLIIGSVVALGAFVVMVDALASRFEISVFLPALVAGGMVGNTLDRIRLGSVRDFLVTPWAIINVADIAVAAGIVGVIFTLATRVPRRHIQLATSGGGTA